MTDQASREHYSATLYGAARLIEVHGLARGKWRDEGGGFCLVAALFEAGTAWGREGARYGDYGSAPGRVWAATERLELELATELERPDGRRWSLDTWSDRQDAPRVIGVLRKAARTARYEAKGQGK